MWHFFWVSITIFCLMWRFICHHQSIYNLDARVLPPSSCQSVEAVPEEKYGLLKQNNLFLPQNTIFASWHPASSLDSPFLCLQWRSLPCHDDLWIWHYCVTDHRIYHVDWLACVGNAKPTRWASDDLWEWRRNAPQPQQASSTCSVSSSQPVTCFS